MSYEGFPMFLISIYMAAIWIINVREALFGSLRASGGGALAKNLEATCDKNIRSNMFILDNLNKNLHVIHGILK